MGDNRYSPEMRRVARIDKELVFDEEGRRYPIKKVLPVNAASTRLGLTGRGISAASQATRDALQRQREELVNVLEALGGEATLRAIAAELRGPVFEELVAQGLPRAQSLAAFVALYPEVFEIAGSGRTRSLRLRG